MNEKAEGNMRGQKEGRRRSARDPVVFPVSPADTVRDTFLIDPAVILIVVGVVMFFITFCGCIGALRENIRLLKTVRRHSGLVVEVLRLGQICIQPMQRLSRLASNNKSASRL